MEKSLFFFILLSHRVREQVFLAAITDETTGSKYIIDSYSQKASFFFRFISITLCLFLAYKHPILRKLFLQCHADFFTSLTHTALR